MAHYDTNAQFIATCPRCGADLTTETESAHYRSHLFNDKGITAVAANLDTEEGAKSQEVARPDQGEQTRDWLLTFGLGVAVGMSIVYLVWLIGGAL